MSILSDKFLHFVNQKKQNIAGLAEAATAYGIEDDEEEYQLYTELEAGGLQVYWFQQYYQGGEVYGPGLKVIAGEDGSLQMINGNYADAVTIGNLRQLILLSGTEGNASEEPVAAWRAEAAVDGTGQLELFLDGSTGEVLAENSLLREAGMTEVTLEGESGTVQEAGYGTGTDVRKAMTDE